MKEVIVSVSCPYFVGTRTGDLVDIYTNAGHIIDLAKGQS